MHLIFILSGTNIRTIDGHTLPRDLRIELDVDPQTIFREVIDRIMTEASLTRCMVRLIYQGQPIDVEVTPSRISHLTENSIIHVFLTPDAQTSGYSMWNDMRNDEHSTDVASLLMTLFSLSALGYFIYWKWNYPAHFSPLASTLLGVFILAALIRSVSVFIRQQENHRSV